MCVLLHGKASDTLSEPLRPAASDAEKDDSDTSDENESDADAVYTRKCARRTANQCLCCLFSPYIIHHIHQGKWQTYHSVFARRISSGLHHGMNIDPLL